MAIRVGRWDCKSCGYKGNLGPNLRCEKCHSPRPKNVKFYLSTDAEIVKDRKKIEEAKAGADWICSYCESHNKAFDKKCHSCGASNKASEKNARLKQISYKTGEVPRNSDNNKSQKNQKLNTIKKPKLEKLVYTSQLDKYKQIVMRNKFFYFVALPLILLFWVNFIIAMVTPLEPEPNYKGHIYSGKVQVITKSWQSVVKAEKKVEVIEEGWNLPADTRYISERQEIHHYDKVFDHTETRTVTKSRKVKVGEEEYVCGQKDLGNGYFEDEYCTRDIYEYEDYEEEYSEDIYRDEPVYQTKYKYYIWRWKPIEYPKTGIGNTITWAEIPEQDKDLIRNTINTTKYFLLIRDKNGFYHKVPHVMEEKWKKININDSINSMESRVFGITFYKSVPL